jgi:hypothetical protein
MNNEMLSSFSKKSYSFDSKFIKIQQKKDPFSLTKCRELEWWFTKHVLLMNFVLRRHENIS